MQMIPPGIPRGGSDRGVRPTLPWRSRVVTTRSISTRWRLPNRRAHELLDFEHHGRQLIVGVSRFDDGRVAEIFLNTNGRSGGEVEVLVRDGAICASLGLQHGIPIGVIRKALMRSPNGAASGVLAAALDLLAAEKRSDVA